LGTEAHQQLRAGAYELVPGMKEIRYGDDPLTAHQPIGEASRHRLQRLSHGRDQLVRKPPECGPMKLLAIADDQNAESGFAKAKCLLQ